jgi:hypothetical protein
MSGKYESPDELKPLERQLAALAPAGPRIERDRLMFLAGVASASPSGELEPRGTVALPRRMWPVATGAFAATSLALLVALFTRPAPQPQVVYVPAAPAPDNRVLPAHSPTEQPAEQSTVSAAPAERELPSPVIRSYATENYLRTRDVALRLGLDALGTSSRDGLSSPAPSYGDCLLSLSPTRSPDSPSPLDFLPRM